MVVSRPPNSGTFVRLPSGAYNPPPQSAEILARSGPAANPTGARQRAMLGLPNWNYANIILTLTDKDGGVITFTPGDGETGPNQPTYYADKLKADSWVFPNGLRLTFQYTAPFNLPSGNSPQIKRRVAARERLLQLARPDAHVRRRQPGSRRERPNGRPDYKKTGVRDSSGAVWNYSLSGVTTPSGVNVLKFIYDSLGRVRSVTDGNNKVTNYFPAKVAGERIARGESVDALSGLASTFFDRGDRPLQIIDPVGRVTTNVYDGTGRMTRTVAPEGNATEYAYDVRGNVTTETRKPKTGTTSTVTTTTYFTGPTVAVCPAAETKRCNKVASVDGPRVDVTDVTSYTYSQSTGQRLTETRPAVTGGTPLMTLVYQSIAGTSGTISLLSTKTERITSSVNVATAYGYETLANRLALKSVTEDSGGLNLITQIEYNTVGNVSTITDPRNKVTAFCFDSGRRLTRMTRLLGALIYVRRHANAHRR